MSLFLACLKKLGYWLKRSMEHIHQIFFYTRHGNKEGDSASKALVMVLGVVRRLANLAPGETGPITIVGASISAPNIAEQVYRLRSYKISLRRHTGNWTRYKSLERPSSTYRDGNVLVRFWNP